MKGNVRARDTQNCGAVRREKRGGVGGGLASRETMLQLYSHGMLAAGFYLNKAEEFLKQ